MKSTLTINTSHSSLESKFIHRLNQRTEKDLYRIRSICEEKPYLSFCSNDYLGLAIHPKVILAFRKGIDEYGVGSGASAVISGYSRAHQALEEELADFFGYEAALLFSTGYMANLGVLETLLGRFDIVYQDKLNHASLVAGGLSSQAKLYRFPHKNYDFLKKQLEKSKVESELKSNNKKEALIVTEGVFSMEGDIASLDQLVELSKEYSIPLMMDDAHGIGVLGKKGRGTLEHFNQNAEHVPILVGTFGKAFGCFGAFVAAKQVWVESFIQFAKPYLYTTALPAAIVEAIRASLHIIKTENHQRIYLHSLIQRFKKGASQLGLNLMDSNTPIQSWMIGNTKETLLIAELLKNKKSILLNAIRPPTVPTGRDRLRISLTAAHTESQIDVLLEGLAWAEAYIQKH